MEFFDVVKNRCSIRNFQTEKEVPDAILNQILETAIRAPSAGNLQSWDFIIVTKQEIKEELVGAALGQRFIAKAPVVIVVCANQIRSAMGYGRRGSELYCIQDTAAAIQTMLLTITALGYGACWVGAFRESAVAAILKTPKEVRPIALIPIGVPKRIPHPTPRIPLKKIIHYETF